MNSKRVFWGMCILFALLSISFFGSIIYGNTILKDSASSLLDLKLKSRILNEQQTALTKAKNDIEKYGNTYHEIYFKKLSEKYNIPIDFSMEESVKKAYVYWNLKLGYNNHHFFRNAIDFDNKFGKLQK